MLPLSDGLHPRRFPIVNLALIAAIFAVWAPLRVAPQVGRLPRPFLACTVDNA
jgi:hypothetical protein